MDDRRPRTRKWLVALALLLATAAVYFRARHCGFVNYDDPDYITRNFHVQQGLTWRGVVWAFTHFDAANWHPLTWLSLMLDCQLFGLNPGAEHLVNVAFHLANTLLLFLLLNRLTGALWRSAVVAGLFALHPLHVESVVWISERKDVLSTCFGLLALLAYTRYAQTQRRAEGPRPGIDPNAENSQAPPPDLECAVRDSTLGFAPGGRSLFYWLSLFCFALGLMAKPMLVTLPLVMLLLDFWPLRRAPALNPRQSVWRHLVWEKWPFFLLTTASCVVTYVAQKTAGAVATIGQVPFGLRAENALVSYFRYLSKLVWPTDLAVFYPLPSTLPAWQAIGAGGLLAALTAWSLWRAAHRPFLLVGWLWYVGTLIPVIGLVQVGAQAMADRYTYFPSIGVFILAVWAVADWAAHARANRWIASIAAAAGLMACALTSEVQIGYWKNSLALFYHALAVTHHNAVAHNNLATALQALGHPEEAMTHYAQAVRLDPNSALLQDNLGVALAREGQVQKAIQCYQRALRLHPGYAEAYNNLGVAWFATGHWREAATNFLRALQLKPDYPEARNNFGGLLEKEGKLEAAIEQFRAALRINPASAQAHFNLALALLKQGREDEAMAQLAEAARFNPKSAAAHFQLGVVLLRRGRVGEAAAQFETASRLAPGDARAQFNLGLALVELGKIPAGLAHLRRAVALKPDWPEALNALAWILATQTDERYRDGAEALRLARRAATLTGEKQPLILNTLAAALAETGNFDAAADTARQALTLARQSNLTGLVQTIQRALQAYRVHQPFRAQGLR